uniref:Uncharacterized protein n=1 Tax=Arundo donax TaxID=35708 RepID=A0A0A9BAF2_ARUDO
MLMPGVWIIRMGSMLTLVLSVRFPSNFRSWNLPWKLYACCLTPAYLILIGMPFLCWMN